VTSFLASTISRLNQCKLPADYYRVSIDIQRYATPAEVAQLVSHSSTWPPQFQSWLKQLGGLIWERSQQPRSYQLTRIADDVSLYRQGTSTGRKLIIAFCGAAQMLFMPTASWLQYFPETDFEFVILRDPGRMGFAGGIRGYAADFSGLLSRLDREIGFSKYADIRCFGASGGGAAALAAGITLAGSCAVSFGGHLPSASPRYGRDPQVQALDQILKAAPQPSSHLYAVFGADHVVDRDYAWQLAAAVTPLTLIAVPGVSSHNVVIELKKRGGLVRLLEETGLHGP